MCHTCDYSLYEHVGWSSLSSRTAKHILIHEAVSGLLPVCLLTCTKQKSAGLSVAGSFLPVSPKSRSQTGIKRGLICCSLHLGWDLKPKKLIRHFKRILSDLELETHVKYLLFLLVSFIFMYYHNLCLCVCMTACCWLCCCLSRPMRFSVPVKSKLL